MQGNRTTKKTADGGRRTGIDKENNKFSTMYFLIYSRPPSAVRRPPFSSWFSSLQKFRVFRLKSSSYKILDLLFYSVGDLRRNKALIDREQVPLFLANMCL